ncbi:branched-chain amino acid transport system II carrier protein [Companilactobacillus sp.]|jgi:LIVCS family branched-chain amino acid:cation transporter|uniref:branched-chain amino acid transport system II carrier protein n=1 Tax=Companilactobacillus sp. TaxID=2767905 RepID=UPI0025BBC687|nr:branched-chain amino acid transport system II carrier protein [Companilactobacillus sp.]MCH4008870.1 branched-chain amino acid transport system II carrier protein [Companilactobacillus sp.]MCH4050951.1 branched-chain amino acid transport system II carrier protein [Companilactobacillus sp.]MCH4076813.1 branched-chain amino acid transport system II carrier protein [Companilactobacillus sp.]MCH4125388.1 branched-chain amino acid transport system II carrier protein [Companilactobacillus sp.]MCH
MKKKLTRRELFFIGSMLFGLFFGAGNLIFPVFLGQQAGSNVWLAVIGLLITGIGLPLLGVAGLGMTESASVFNLANKINRPYAYVFTILLYLIIGPLFATPRLATTSFQMGIVPFVNSGLQKPVLMIFSIIFFATSWWFARKPSKIMTYVGKWLTPIFLILLGILILVALIKPMGGLSAIPQGSYAKSPVLAGFTEGYNTMDALASLAFGVVVIDGIKVLGVTDPREIAKDTIKAGTISVVLMGIIYTLLALLGAMSLGKLDLASNGGITLASIFNYYFGSFGNILLAVIVIIACLKTSIGLITAFGEAMHEMFPKVSYQVLIIIASVLPCVFANVGLTNLIQYSTPALMFVYPLAITLILLAVLTPFLGSSKWVYGMTTLFTFIPAVFAGIEAMKFLFHGQGWFNSLMNLNQLLPWSSLGLGWVVPALIGLIIGYIISLITKENREFEA